MKIAVFGTGVVGQTISEKLIELGHEVMMGTRNVEDLAARTGLGQFGRPSFADWHAGHKMVKTGTFSDAAAFGAMAINATNGHGTLQAVELAGKENLAHKILIDISNALDFTKGFPPTLFVCNDDSLGEQVQKALPDTKVVKSLNTMTAYIMVNPALLPGDHNVFMSGNDEGAKEEVKELLVSFGWPDKNIIDTGDITTARGTEQLVALWVRLMGVFKNNGMFNFHVVKA